MFHKTMNAQQQLSQLYKLAQLKKEFAKERFVGKSFADAVTVTIDGEGQIVDMTIVPQALAEGVETIAKFTAEAHARAFATKETALRDRVKDAKISLSVLTA